MPDLFLRQCYRSLPPHRLNFAVGMFACAESQGRRRMGAGYWSRAGSLRKQPDIFIPDGRNPRRVPLARCTAVRYMMFRREWGLYLIGSRKKRRKMLNPHMPDWEGMRIASCPTEMQELPALDLIRRDLDADGGPEARCVVGGEYPAFVENMTAQHW